MDKLATIPKNEFPAIQRSVTDQLPVMVQKFVLAKDSEVIADLSPLDRELYLLSVITELQLSVGHNNKSKDGISNEQITTALSAFIFDTHKTLTKEELRLANLRYFIENPVQEQGVNLKNFAQAIRGYLNDPLKIKAMAEYNRMLELVKVKPDLTPEEKEQNIQELCLKFFEEYKDKEMIRQFIMPVDMCCRIYYDMLVKHGIINYSKDQLKVFKAKAEEIYLAQLNQSKLSRQISKTTYEQMLTSVIDNDNRPLFNLRGKLALLEYFDFLISNNKHLKELLK